MKSNCLKSVVIVSKTFAKFAASGKSANNN
jgi:hypothetical protein